MKRTIFIKRTMLLSASFISASFFTSAVLGQSLPEVSSENGVLKLDIPYLVYNKLAYSVSLSSTETSPNLVFRVDAKTLKSVPFEEDDLVLDPKDGACTNTAKAGFKACEADVEDAMFIGTALCFNTTAKDCNSAVLASQEDAMQECDEQLEARLLVCKALGEAAYDPNMNPANFMSKAEIIASPNKFFPLKPGNMWVYKSGSDTNTVSVTDVTRTILGITAIEVSDIEKDDKGNLIESTTDWYAQDRQGNVWYMGETASNYEEGRLVDLDGSWLAGNQGAKAGIIVRAAPVLKETMRQEFLLGEAEDLVTTLSLTANENSVAAGVKCDSKCLETQEFTPIEPGNIELKYYYPGVGKILIHKPASGKREELVSYSLK
jgi:hypothetical protein